MIINNLELIKPFLKFESNDIYYHLQILKRRKDCLEHEKARNNNARCIKTYYVHSIEYLEDRFDEIKKLCKHHQARAYINLNAKSYVKTAFEMNIKVAQRMLNNQFEYISRSYESAAGMSNVNIGNSKWIVDIDEKEIDNVKWNTIHGTINYLCDPITPTIGGEYKIIATIPTKNGWHLITKPFNRKQFSDKYPEIDIQTNNPTLLYYEND